LNLFVEQLKTSYFGNPQRFSYADLWGPGLTWSNVWKKTGRLNNSSSGGVVVVAAVVVVVVLL